MVILKALWLGIVQGITEFFPVSSSAHLALFGNLFSMSADTFSLFSAILHVGTLAAVCGCFSSVLLRMARETRGIFRDIRENAGIWHYNLLNEQNEMLYRRILGNNSRRLLAMLIVSTLPAILIGYPAERFVSPMNMSLLSSGLGMLGTSVILFVAGFWPDGDRTLGDATMRDALLIGVCHGLGCLPGLSRMALALGAAVFLGFRRGFAIRYSLLLSIPAVIGAVSLEVILHAPGKDTAVLVLCALFGALVSAAVGSFCLRWVLARLRRIPFRIFALYCLCAGCAAIACYFL